jgi:hypothetical protein
LEISADARAADSAILTTAKTGGTPSLPLPSPAFLSCDVEGNETDAVRDVVGLVAPQTGSILTLLLPCLPGVEGG